MKELIRRNFAELPWSWWRPYEIRFSLRLASTPLSYYPHMGQAWTKIQSLPTQELKGLIAQEAGRMTERWYRDQLDHGRVRTF